MYLLVKKFQSTLPRGERPKRRTARHGGKLFQSTLPRGERREVGNTLISISRFQSTLPRGERRCSRSAVEVARFGFQSTLPRGERRIACCNLLRSFYFNPRSREGSDTGWNTHSSADSIFQSTLPRGERHSTYILLLSKNTISIHAPARGATNLISASIHFDKISIHAPARGATFTKI